MKNRQQLLTVLALAVVGLWIGDKFVLEPLLASWRGRNDRIAELRQRVSKGEQLIARERALRDRWESMRAHALPEDISAAEDRIIHAFNQWEKDSGLSVTLSDPQSRRTSDDFATLECRADATGSLAAITRFLHAMEMDPLAVKAESVEWTAKNSDGSQLSLVLTVSGLQLSPPQRP